MPQQDTSSSNIQVTVKTSDAAAATTSPGKLPAESLDNAKTAFQDFSLSKFPDPSSAPSNFVAAGQAVSEVQRTNQVNHLKSLDASGRRLQLALPESELKKYLPSFDGKTVLLSELMDLLQTKMRGTEFYVSGHPTLVRLSIQSQAAEIIQGITNADGGSNKG